MADPPSGPDDTAGVGQGPHVSEEDGVGAPSGPNDTAGVGQGAHVSEEDGVGAPSGPDDTAWDRVLEEMEGRLATWWAALEGRGPFPADYEMAATLGPVPGRLRPKALTVLAGQRDVEAAMSARRAAIGALLHRPGTTDRRQPAPRFVDRRA